ncbi:MAG: carbohydrate ABC transporter permease [Oscillospiraceae bacterium]|nr:carbohydrate ABC transporter permease [Oscillospiraceae bacterium]
MAKLTGKNALAERGDRGLNIAINVLLVIICIVVIYPLWFVLVASLSDPRAISAGEVFLWPVDFTLDGYGIMDRYPQIWTGYFNTLIYAAVGTAWTLLKLIPAGFALSRPELPGRRWITLFFMLTMYFSGGMVPRFVLVSNIGWYNHPAAILFSTGVSAYNLVLVRSFFMSNIPESLFDAARVDGCSIIRFFVRIVLPLSGSIIAIMTLFSVQSFWNQYLDAQMFLKKQEYWTLQQVVRSITENAQKSNDIVEPGLMDPSQYEEMERKRREAALLKYSVVIVSAIPMIVIYPFIQRHFVKGIMVGAVKG